MKIEYEVALTVKELLQLMSIEVRSAGKDVCVQVREPDGRLCLHSRNIDKGLQISVSWTEPK